MHHCRNIQEMQIMSRRKHIETESKQDTTTSKSKIIMLTRSRLKLHQKLDHRHSTTKSGNMIKRSHQHRFKMMLAITFTLTLIINSIYCQLSSDYSNNRTTSIHSYSNNIIQNYESTSSSHQQQQQQQHIVASFSTPNQAINISHVTYDPLYDTVYLGASNALYQLNGIDLSEPVDHQVTGPIQDHPSCGITECNGYEDFMKPTTNVNKLLVIDYQHQKLLACFSTKQGACRRYQLNNISQREDLISMAVAANDDNSSTYAFIAPARYDNSNEDSLISSTNIDNMQQQQQQVLYVGTTYTKVGQSRDLLVPAIGTRRLDDGPNLLKLYENSFLDSARIDINSHLRDYFLVNYLYGFASSNYIYFITVQRKATSRDYEELGYHTRIARICITDSSYNSYTEVDLKCVAKSKNNNNKQTNNHQIAEEYPLLQDAILVDAGSQLLQSLAQNDQQQHHTTSSRTTNSFSYGSSSSSSHTTTNSDDGKVLLGVFSSARDHTQYPGDHSALCAFSLSQIEEKFNQNIHNCYTGKMSSRNMEYIAGNVQECPKNGQGGNVVNFCHETLKINGTEPIISEAAIQFANTTLTAVTATAHINPPTNLKNIYASQLAQELSSANQSATLKQQIAFIKQQASQQQQQAQNSQTVAFLGTANGYIKKILLNNASLGHEFEQLQLEPGSQAPVLSDLHLHSSGRSLLAATPYKLFKVSLDNCAQYSNCRECSQARNPYCGWCSLKRSCTTRAECTGEPTPEGQLSSSSSSGGIQRVFPAASAIFQQLVSGGQASAQSQSQAAKEQQAFANKWISNESAGKCIDLQAIVPDKIPITSTGKIDLHIDKLPRLPAGHAYRCVFDQREQTSATPTRFGLSCPLPKVTQRPKIEPGRDHAIVELALRSSETNTDFLNGKITFFECQLHTTCKDCLTTNWGCNWCLNENICLFNTSRCERGSRASSPQQQPMSTTVSNYQPTTIINGPQSERRSIISGQPAAATANANTIGLVGQCPTFDLRDKQDILIPDGSEQRELSLRVKNMPQVKGPIECLVEIESAKIQLRARIEHDRVICDNSTYSYSSEVGLLNGQLIVQYSDNNIVIDKTNFTLYKCHLLGAHLNRADCSLCKRTDPAFACHWCSGSCRHKSRCPAQQSPLDASCPAPRIDSVWPLSGPVYGGTRLTIEGSNLGQSFEEIESRVRLGNSTCRPLESEYRVSNRIVCITGPLQNTHQSHYIVNNNQQQQQQQQIKWNTVVDIEVGNRAGYSLAPSKFHFKPIYLRDHQPRYGPQAGGTRITLTGTNLNVGSSVQVFLDELPCMVELQSLSSEQLVCRTSPSKHSSRLIRQLKLVIDDAQIVREGSVFLYTQDPTITRVTPLRSYLAGGRPINVFGTNLTSVQAPKMVLLDPVTGRKINESLCLLNDDPTRMQCPSPAVNLNLLEPTTAMLVEQQQQQDHNSISYLQSRHLLDLFGNSEALTGAAMEESPLRFRIAFVMDDVFSSASNNKQFQSEIYYTTDPRLYPFASQDYKSAQEASSLNLVGAGDPMHMTSQQQRLYQLDADTYLIPQQDPVLVLHGEHLRTAVSDYEITVTIGTDLCNFTQLTQTKLVCSVALDRIATPTDEEGRLSARQLPLVVVRIGFNLRFELGYVQYHPELVEQIFRNIASSNEAANQLNGGFAGAMQLPPQNYMPIERENLAQKVGSYVFSTLLICLYVTLALVLLFFVYGSFVYAYKFQEKCKLRNQYKRVLSRIESIEKSVRSECRLATMALQSDLNELIGHIELSGCPLWPRKLFLARLLSNGNDLDNSDNSLNVMPLLNVADNNKLNNIVNLDQQQLPMINPQHSSLIIGAHLERPLAMQQQTQANSMLDSFHSLLSNKTFLINFVNTLERQPTTTGRDKIAIGNALSACLLSKPDYMLEVLRTLVLQHIEQAVANERRDELVTGYQETKTTRRNLYKKRPQSSKTLTKTLLSRARLGNQASNLSKVVSGSANSLMASTQVAAQMLLSRVGATGKSVAGNEPNWTPIPTSRHQQQHDSPPMANYHHTLNLHASNKQQQLNTTAFNQRQQHQHHNQTLDPRSLLLNTSVNTTSSLVYLNGASQSSSLINPLSSDDYAQHKLDCAAGLFAKPDSSIVERLLFNWLAVNMYEHFQAPGPLGQSFYLLFEALKHQLDRGPVDSITGDAYYSLSSSNLLREPSIQFDTINLYLIVEADLLQPVVQPAANQAPKRDSIYEDPIISVRQHSSISSMSNNTITLTVRVLDCDTISQVKAKCLDALYRNSPASTRLPSGDVELFLRHQQQANEQQATYADLKLEDEDESSLVALNGKRRVNTLRHYGVSEQAIMMLNKKKNQQPRQQLDILTGGAPSDVGQATSSDFNPYSEILYGPTANNQQQTSMQQPKVCHLTSSNRGHQVFETSRNCLYLHSEESSPGSNSPSMMLVPGVQRHQHQQQHYLYHASSSSSSSTGQQQHQQQMLCNNQQQPIYCQIGSISARSNNQHEPGYYCQINPSKNYFAASTLNVSKQHQATTGDETSEQNVYLGRMLASKGTVQSYIDSLFKSILNAKPTGTSMDAGANQYYQQRVDHYESKFLCTDVVSATGGNTRARRATSNQQAGASNQSSSCCPIALKWLFDLLDEAAMKTGVTEASVLDQWKANIYLVRFWAQLIRRPQLVLDVDSSRTLDASLAVVAQALVDSSCTASSPSKDSINKMIFANDIPKYSALVRSFHQDLGSMKPVCEQELAAHMAQSNSSVVDLKRTRLAVKELCQQAINNESELVNSLQNDFIGQQTNLPAQVSNCLRTTTIGYYEQF